MKRESQLVLGGSMGTLKLLLTNGFINKKHIHTVKEMLSETTKKITDYDILKFIDSNKNQND